MGCPGAEWGLELEEDYQLQLEVNVLLLIYMYFLISTFLKSTLWDLGWRDIHDPTSSIYPKHYKVNKVS